MPKISAQTLAEHRRKTWDALLDATGALVLERSFDAVSMRDIAQRAGIARTAIYNYAPDTKTLLIEATKRGSEQARAAVSRVAADTSVPPSERLRAIVAVLLLDFAEPTSNFLATQALERTLAPDEFTEAVEPFRADIGVHVMDVVREGVEAGEFALIADAELTLALMVGVMESALRNRGETRQRRATVAAGAAQFLLNALALRSHPTDARAADRRPTSRLG
jgi:AcrR family transcriptional regulator